MEGQRLCAKCREEAMTYYGSRVLIPARAHCHHPEPEPEKPACKWCEVWRAIKLTWHDTPFWNDISYLATKSMEPLVKCPVCGAKI